MLLRLVLGASDPDNSYVLLTEGVLQSAIGYIVAHGALVMTTLGDNSRPRLRKWNSS
jgi:hypothetical protein